MFQISETATVNKNHISRQITYTYLSGSTVRNQSQLRASLAEILFLGSRESILSNKSNAGSGIRGPYFSRTFRGCCCLGFTVAKPGK